MHPQHPGRTRRDRVLVHLVQNVFFRDDDLDRQVVVHGVSGRGLDVAERVRARADPGLEFHFDEPALGVVVGFPALLDVVAAELDGVFAEDTLAFAADLGGVFFAGFGYHLRGLVDSPVHPSDSPADLPVSALGDDACQTELDGDIADRMDYRGDDHCSDEVCGREDSSGVFVETGHERSLDFEVAGKVDGLGEICDGFGGKEVIDDAHETVGRGRNVTRQQVGEGKVVFPSSEMRGLREKPPAKELSGLGYAFWAIVLERMFCSDLCLQDHLDRLDTDLWLVRCEDQLAGEQCAR